MVRQLRALRPDVLFVQELHPLIDEAIVEALGHDRVVDSGNEAESWQLEGNVYWNKDMWEEVEHFSKDIGQEEPLRRLFCVKLKCKATNQVALFSTAHLTWQGHTKEIETGENLRRKQALCAAAALESIGFDGPIFFGGDMNESFWPKRVFNDHGFVDCFAALSLPVQPTHPTRPSVRWEEVNGDAALDWLFAKGGPTPLLAAVIKDMVGLSSDDPFEQQALAIQPSDHMPVMAVYRL